LESNIRKNEKIQRLAAQLYIARNSLNSSGKWLVEIDDLDIEDNVDKDLRTINIPTLQIIYIISLCFKKITLFKPLYNPNNTYFLLAETPVPITINPILDKIIEVNKYPSTLIDNFKMDTKFLRYIQDIRNNIENMSDSYNNLNYIFQNALIYWDLPGNVDNISKVKKINKIRSYNNVISVPVQMPITEPYDFTYFKYGEKRTGTSYPQTTNGQRSISSDSYIGMKMLTLSDITTPQIYENLNQNENENENENENDDKTAIVISRPNDKDIIQLSTSTKEERGRISSRMDRSRIGLLESLPPRSISPERKMY
jgi:hypothetical protein